MRLIATVLLTLLFTADFSFAQQIIYSEDFESSNAFPDGYKLINNDGQIPVVELYRGSEEAWIVGEIPHEPNNNFAITSSKYENPDIRADDWMILPKISITEDNYLLWRARNSSNKSENWETYQVLISTTGENIENDFTPIYGNMPPYSFEYPKISLEDYAGEEVYIAFRGTGKDGWAMFLDDIQIVKVFDVDVSLEGSDLPKYTPLGEFRAFVEISNKGLQTLESVTLNWLVEGESEVQSESFDGLTLEFYESQRLTVAEPFKFNKEGIHKIKMWVSEPNGGADDFPGNDTLNFTVNATNSPAQRKILFERFTGTWCGWCSKGGVIMKELLEYYDNIIPVAIHGGSGNEPMRTEVGVEIMSDFPGGFPSAALDRVKFPGENAVRLQDNKWEQFLKERMKSAAPAIIRIDKVYETATRHLSVTVGAEFVSDVAGDFKFNAYIVENNVVGGNEYDQYNNSNNDPDFPDLYQKGNPIEGYIHQNVLRDALGGAHGYNPDRNGMPPEIKSGDSYAYTFETSLDNAWDENEIYIVAYVVDYDEESDESEVLNAAATDLLDQSFVAANAEDFSAEIFPNPAKETLFAKINLAETARVKITLFDVFGGEVALISDSIFEPGARVFAGDVSKLSAGAYYCKIETGGVAKTFVVNIFR